MDGATKVVRCRIVRGPISERGTREGPSGDRLVADRSWLRHAPMRLGSWFEVVAGLHQFWS